MTAMMSFQFHETHSVADVSEDETKKEDGSSVTSQKEPEKFSLTREELDSRMRLVVERSIEAILIRGQSEKRVCSDIHDSLFRSWIDLS